MESLAGSAARFGGISLLRVQSDERLAQLAHHGSDDAFDVLVRRYRRELVRSARRVVANDRAEDAVQQALLDAHQALVRNGTPDRFRPWLHRIALNAALKLAGEQGDVAPSPVDEGQTKGGESPEEMRERRERLRRVVGAIGALPGRQRQALVLHELEGRTHDEIARELGLSRGAVRQLIHRARNAVRSAASSLIPPAFLIRPLTAGGGAASRVGEAAGGIDGAGAATKLAVAVVVVGGVAGGVSLDRNGADRPQAASAAGAPESTAGVSGTRAPSSNAEGHPGQSFEAGSPNRSGGGNSGPGGGGDDSSRGPGSGHGDDNSGSSGGGSGDEGEVVHDRSGSGSSRSGSSGSGSSGSDSADELDDSSGSGSSGSGSSGSGSLTSGSSGGGSSGSGSSGSDSGDLDDD